MTSKEADSRQPLKTMRYNAKLYDTTPDTGAASMPAMLNELSGVGSRQIAERDQVVSRLYSAVLAGAANYPTGRPVWVEIPGVGGAAGETFIGYPLLQRGRVLRLHRRDGEFLPGLVLERLGAYERSGGLLVTGSDDWFIAQDGPSVYRTSDFRTYEDVPALRGKLNGPLLWIGATLVAGGADTIYTTIDGAAWLTILVPGAAEVWALAWDGLALWVAAEGGTFTVDLGTSAVIQIDPAPAHGLSYRFMNFDLYRAAYDGSGYSLYARNGDFFRSISFPLHGLAHNWVAPDGWHYVTDQTGTVWRFDAATEWEIGTVYAAGREASWGQSTFVLRDTVLAVGYGRLGRVAGDTLHVVYDFGDDVRAYPCPGGFVIARRDGLLYRVRRV
jgi:hypothetical protein